MEKIDGIYYIRKNQKKVMIQELLNKYEGINGISLLEKIMSVNKLEMSL